MSHSLGVHIPRAVPVDALQQSNLPQPTRSFPLPAELRVWSGGFSLPDKPGLWCEFGVTLCQAWALPIFPPQNLCCLLRQSNESTLGVFVGMVSQVSVCLSQAEVLGRWGSLEGFAGGHGLCFSLVAPLGAHSSDQLS